MIAGLEYAAQAMAVHVGLTTDISKNNASVGYFGAVRDVQIGSHTFHQFAEDLTVDASLIFGQQMSFMYSFSMKANQIMLLQGRASIFIKGPEANA